MIKKPLTPKTAIQYLLRNKIITVDRFGFYHTKIDGGLIVTIKGKKSSLRRWLYYIVFGEFPSFYLSGKATDPRLC